MNYHEMDQDFSGKNPNMFTSHKKYRKSKNQIQKRYDDFFMSSPAALTSEGNVEFHF